jgi:hypothetical protein
VLKGLNGDEQCSEILRRLAAARGAINSLTGEHMEDRDGQGAAWLTSKPQHEGSGLGVASDTEAFAGRLAKARKLTRQAIDVSIRSNSKESAATWQAIAAQREAVFGYPGKAKQDSAFALKLGPPSQAVLTEAGLAFALAGDTARAESLAKELETRFPLDTQIQSIWLPAIRGQIQLNRRQPDLALNALHAPSPIEFGNIQFEFNSTCLYTVYVRGESYLAAGQGAAAVTEFHKILDHSGAVWNCWTGALAHLGVARANVLQARTSQGADADAPRVRAAYKDFLASGKTPTPTSPS